MKKLNVLMFVIVAFTVSTIMFALPAVSQTPVVVSEKTIYDYNDNSYVEKQFSDKTFNVELSAKPTTDSVASVDLSAIPIGTKIIDGSIDVLIRWGDSNICQLYLIDDYLNSEPLTEDFVCNGQNNVDLNTRGYEIFSAKTLDSSIELKVFSKDKTKSYWIDESQMNVDLLYKKPQYFAKIGTNSVVEKVIVADDEFISKQNGVWIETWLDGLHRKNFAGVGYFFNPVDDMFVPPQPFKSWELNKETGKWVPPIPYPSDGLIYDWNESSLAWKLRE